MSTVIAISDEEQSFAGMIGSTAVMQSVFHRIRILANTRIPVLIEGETGVGKEMVVRALRSCSGEGRYVDLNCAAIPNELVESELFGHERGAFTGALRRHVGILAQANGGMLFLDEISGLPLQSQAKLLRAIETGEFRPLGSERLQRSEFRLVAAANENLDEAVRNRRFRLDLLHRLGAAKIVVPPLRERREDIALLANAFLLRFRRDHGGCGPVRFSEAALRALRHAPWRGNVRELRHVVEAAAAVTPRPVISEEDVRELLGAGMNGPFRQITLAAAVRAAEREAIREALESAQGNRDNAAKLLGISVATLYRRIAVCGDEGEVF